MKNKLKLPATLGTVISFFGVLAFAVCVIYALDSSSHKKMNDKDDSLRESIDNGMILLGDHDLKLITLENAQNYQDSVVTSHEDSIISLQAQIDDLKKMRRSGNNSQELKNQIADLTSRLFVVENDLSEILADKNKKPEADKKTTVVTTKTNPDEEVEEDTEEDDGGDGEQEEEKEEVE